MDSVRYHQYDYKPVPKFSYTDYDDNLTPEFKDSPYKQDVKNAGIPIPIKNLHINMCVASPFHKNNYLYC